RSPRPMLCGGRSKIPRPSDSPPPFAGGSRPDPRLRSAHCLAATAARSAAQGGRDKEVHVGVHLTKRDASRFRPWHAGLIALVLAMALGGIRSGASWGASAYDPSSDPYSMQNITANDGVQAWWNAGYTGKGVDV